MSLSNPKQTLSTPRRSDLTLKIGRTRQGEEVFTNAKSGGARITICIPTWKDSADALLCTLARLQGASDCTLLLFDDGSGDADLTRQLVRHILRYPGPARLISARKNRGRSYARNRLNALAETDWVLFLDADMQPDDEAFILRYISAIEASTDPALYTGGFSLMHAFPTKETLLHAAQSAASECLPAEVRSVEPGRYVFTSNILCHREVLNTVEFDPGFEGWGWEDVDWGLRVAARFPIEHLDNPATHLGLEPDEKLISKYAQSAENFARLIERHPDAMQATPLYRMARWARRLPLRERFERMFKRLAQSRAAPLRVRLVALKLFRATVYGARL